MSKMNSLHNIVEGGYCIGCGACNAVDPSIRIALDEYGKYQANVSRAATELGENVLNVCPFSDEGPNEDAIGKRIFAEDCSHDSQLGYYRSLFVGHVAEGKYRETGASGGIITWLLVNMLQEGMVDHVIHVKKAGRQKNGCLFKYGMSSSAEEIMDGAKSRYYPVEISRVMEQVRKSPGRYVFVGLPCFVKAVRRLMESDPVIRERIKFCVGLVCGHLKSAAFADSFAWQVGIAPGSLEEIDFRVKIPGRSAGNYGVYFRGGGLELIKPTREFLGANWGHNFFRYAACDYCDDVFAETADVAIGDAWLPKYETDSGGNCVVVVRNPILGEVFNDAIQSGRLKLGPSTVEEITLSQAGGLRDRREGLGYRLYLRQKKKTWAPSKRVAAQKPAIPLRRMLIYKNRSNMAMASHRYWKIAVDKGSFGLFENKMNSMIFFNLVLYQGILPTLSRAVQKISKKLGKK